MNIIDEAILRSRAIKAGVEAQKVKGAWEKLRIISQAAIIEEEKVKKLWESAKVLTKVAAKQEEEALNKARTLLGIAEKAEGVVVFSATKDVKAEIAKEVAKEVAHPKQESII